MRERRYPKSLRRWTGVVIAALALPALPAANAAPPADTGGCADVRVISARGTFEPQFGSLLLTPLATRIARESGRAATATELQYPASRDADSATRGAENLVTLLNAAAAACPDQRYVLLGYSQGARVIETVARGLRPTLSERAADRIGAIALFGNPFFNRDEPYNRGTFDPALPDMQPHPLGALAEFADRLWDYCNAGDRVCNGGDPAAGFGNALSVGHLTYFLNDSRDQAAAFVQDRLRAS
ncbi:cutinase family protein [Nocardia sp. NPDC048505]|uniref:cutinase family protein n=1 Tax=unclassified Nocardia TaxID=2637762 RepID=UPI0033D93D00